MAPHTLDTILRPPQWPASLSNFATWCLMWDPKSRPTSSQALAHDYFKDTFDPLQPKSSSKLLGNRKQSNASTNDSFKDAQEPLQSLATKTSSRLRKSLFRGKVSAPAVPQHTTVVQPASPAVQTVMAPSPAPPTEPSVDPNATKRVAWTDGLPSNTAPVPVPPLSAAVTATDTRGNHYAEIHRQGAKRSLNGQSGLASPASGHRESFISHLRKRARRFSTLF